MPFEFQKEDYFRKWLFSNHCLCRLVQCVSIKLGTSVQWAFVVITNKSARICLKIFGDSVIQILKSRKTRKSGLIPMSGQEKRVDLFLVFPAKLET